MKSFIKLPSEAGLCAEILVT